MTIRFIVNDPQSNFADERTIVPHQDRPADRAGFQLFAAEPEDVYPFGTDGFFYWQCREAALRGLDTWEAVAGPLQRWALDKKRLDLITPITVSNGHCLSPFPPLVTPMCLSMRFTATARSLAAAFGM